MRSAAWSCHFPANRSTLRTKAQRREEKINLIEKKQSTKSFDVYVGNINDQSQVNQMVQTLYNSGILNVPSHDNIWEKDLSVRLCCSKVKKYTLR